MGGREGARRGANTHERRGREREIGRPLAVGGLGGFLATRWRCAQGQLLHIRLTLVDLAEELEEEKKKNKRKW